MAVIRSAPPPRAHLTPNQMRQGISRFEKSIEQVEAFDPQTIQTYQDTLKAEALSALVDSALVQTFGEDTAEYRRYMNAKSFSWPLSMGQRTPIREIQQSLEKCRARSLHLLREAISFLKQELELAAAGEVAAEKSKAAALPSKAGTHVFIGHGHSLVWRVLKDFLEDRLGLSVDEFNRVPVAGIATSTRLSEMLDSAAFAFLIMTAEDEQTDGKVRARENVVHEVGLFQGRLGFERAIVLLEEGCEQFSNIHGLGYIKFPKGNIAAKSEEIREVLEHRGLVERNRRG
jgi:predicted nucleotide-binding protein